MNEAVERAHRDGILTGASLMVGGPAAADAVRRARALPSLRVGLHLVVIEGPAVLPPKEIPDLMTALPRSSLPGLTRQSLHTSGMSTLTADARIKSGHDGLVAAECGRPAGQFPSDQLRLALRYFFRPDVRRQLAAEIRAQFAAFAQTGLPLDHANAHKHMHLHPTVGGLMLDIGREYGLRAVRIPAEPVAVLARCGHRARVGDRALHAWTGHLRARARRAGLATNDHAFGLAWSGHMTAAKLLRLAPHLPDGVSEIYFHPASRRDALLTALMPEYEHEAELAALLDPRVRGAFGAIVTSFSEMTARATR